MSSWFGVRGSEWFLVSIEGFYLYRSILTYKDLKLHSRFYSPCLELRLQCRFYSPHGNQYSKPDLQLHKSNWLSITQLFYEIFSTLTNHQNPNKPLITGKTFAPALKILDRNNVSIIFNNEVVDLSHNRTNSKSDLIDDEIIYDLSLF